jgi:choline dehydrogenase-like flavoprotein
MALSIAVTAVMGFLLEYLGTRVWGAYHYASPATFWIVVAIFALGLGPLLVVMRKWSIAVPMLIVGGLMFILEIFNHYSTLRFSYDSIPAAFTMIQTGGARVWDWNGGALFGITSPLLIALVAGVIETLIVPASVGLQKLLVAGLRPKDAVTNDELRDFFHGSVGDPEEEKPGRDFGFIFLRVAGIAFTVYLGYVILGVLAGAADLPLVGTFFLNPAATINTFGKLSILAAVATIGAFNVRVRREALLILVIGHILAVGISLWLLFTARVSYLAPERNQFILASAIVDGLLLVVLAIMMFRYPAFKSAAEGIDDVEIDSPAATASSISFLVLGIIFSLLLVAAIVARFLPSPPLPFFLVWGIIWGNPDPLVINTVTMLGTCGAICFLLWRRAPLRRYFTAPLVIALTLMAIAAFVYALGGPLVVRPGGDMIAVIPAYLPVAGGVYALLLLVILGARSLLYNVDYNVTSLAPGSAECVMALHDALREKLTPDGIDPLVWRREVLTRIDEHIAGIRGRRRGLVGFPFAIMEHIFPPLAGLRPGFSLLSREEARWLLRCYILRPVYERERAAIPPLAELFFKVGDILNSLVSLAYFSSTPGQIDVGYVLPDGRGRLQPQVPSLRPPESAGLAPLPVNNADPNWRKPLTPPELAGRLVTPRLGVPDSVSRGDDEVDYCIIGSGAAGGVLAYRLATETKGSARICVLEQGGHFGPATDFSDDEMRMVRMLYTEGGLQVTRSFDFTILQGSCVGGTTVINNAVCFQMPESSRREWRALGIDPDLLAPHYAAVQREIGIDVLTDRAVNERVEAKFAAAVNGHNAMPDIAATLSSTGRVMGNFNECNGCGLCNIGCRRMRKMSVLETYLPWASALGVRVLAGTGAVQCEHEGSGATRRVRAVVVRRPDGTFGRIAVRKGVIVAAGAIASSRFLMRSGLGGEHVGEGMSCNYAAPTLVEFDDRLDAFDGVQITMYAAPESYDAIFETTFNPPGTHSIVFPQYFGRHAAMMREYGCCVNFGALIGSDPVGTVAKDRSIIFGRAVDWRQSPGDIARIRMALATLLRFGKAAGARRMLLPTLPVLSVPLDGDISGTIRAMERVLDGPGRLNFVTAHPQGGNMMADPSVKERVVEPDFRVRGCENLYLCDASIFPRGIRVNPQWTIMALASKAGEEIARR